MSTVRTVSSILSNCGVSDHDGRVVSQLVDFACRCVAQVSEEAQGLADLAGRKQVSRDDVLLAVKYRLDAVQTKPPPRDFLLQLAAEKNAQPLPPLKQSYGLRLPPDRYCLLQQNYKLRTSDQIQQIAQQQQPETVNVVEVKLEASNQPESLPSFELGSTGGLSADVPPTKRMHLDDDYDM